MKDYDSSHDINHIHRVWKVAKQIANEESKTQQLNLELVELAALLHDVGDFKSFFFKRVKMTFLIIQKKQNRYSHDENASSVLIQKFLSNEGVKQQLIDKVIDIVTKMSFRYQLKADERNEKHEFYIELSIVSDADKIDALGAIGLSRVFVFSGKRDQPMYDPDIPVRANLSSDQYNNSKMKSTAINHLYEKILLLKDKMKTHTGRELAVKRHHFVQDFIDQFLKEWNGE